VLAPTSRATLFGAMTARLPDAMSYAIQSTNPTSRTEKYPTETSLDEALLEHPADLQKLVILPSTHEIGEGGRSSTGKEPSFGADLRTAQP
jgi:hypothetical protein